MTRTCFILDELYPVDRGGIGRLMYNIVHQAKSQHPELDLHILVAKPQTAASTLMSEAFAGIATLHFLSDDHEVSSGLGIAGLAQAAAITQNLLDPVKNGLRVLDALQLAQAKVGAFDHIEIPDHMGLGAVVLMARRAGIAFQQAQITCRLHSSLSAIIAVEPFFHTRSDWIAPRVEFERYSLEYADKIIAHIPAIATFNQDHFGFNDTWMDKVETAFPPAIWPEVGNNQATPLSNPDFIFTSRFQPFKRPELFIKAAIAFLDQQPAYPGRFRLISYGFNREYIDNLRMLIPARYVDHIHIQVDLPLEQRQKAMENGIIVQPSAYESLCTLAFEVSGQGMPILLARDCVAFGDFDRWIDGENCMMFDPEPRALAKVMQDALSWWPSRKVDTSPDPAYFALPAQPPEITENPAQSLSLLIGPLRTLQEFRVFDTFKHDMTTHIDTIHGYAHERYKDLAPDMPAIHWLPADQYQGAQIRSLSQNTDLVILASPAALPDYDFIQTGRKITRKGQAFSANSRSGDASRLNIYPGKLKTLLASDYRLCPPCLMLHRDDLGLISPRDDRDIVLRLMKRLSDSDIDLVLCPTPMVFENPSLLDLPPDRRLLGYQANSNWKHGVRTIGIDVKSARYTPFLTETPIPPDAPLSMSLRADTVQTLTVQLENPLFGDIIGIRIENRSETEPVIVSLHHGPENQAIECHNRGQQCRKFAPKVRYVARWGPIWTKGPLTIVATATSDVEINLDKLIVISRE